MKGHHPSHLLILFYFPISVHLPPIPRVSRKSQPRASLMRRRPSPLSSVSLCSGAANCRFQVLSVQLCPWLLRAPLQRLLPAPECDSRSSVTLLRSSFGAPSPARLGGVRRPGHQALRPIEAGTGARNEVNRRPQLTVRRKPTAEAPASIIMKGRACRIDFSSVTCSSLLTVAAAAERSTIKMAHQLPCLASRL